MLLVMLRAMLVLLLGGFRLSRLCGVVLLQVPHILQSPVPNLTASHSSAHSGAHIHNIAQCYTDDIAHSIAHNHNIAHTGSDDTSPHLD